MAVTGRNGRALTSSSPFPGLGGSLALSGLLILSACGAPGPPQRPVPRASVIVDEVPDWAKEAMPADVDRVEALASVWRQALEEAQARGFRRAVASEGALLDPSAGLLRPAPAPGSYSCRMLQLGSTAPRVRPFSLEKPGFCYVGVDAQNRLWLSKQTGALRRQGFLWEDVNPRRMIFLGARAARGERPPAYGSSADRDLAGTLERIGPLRFRLVTPKASGDHRLEVIELTPAPVQPDE